MYTFSRGRTKRQSAITLFLCGDVMTGRGIDQILPHPGKARLFEPCVHSALGYVQLAEEKNGPIARPADFAYPWGDALDAWRRAGPAHRQPGDGRGRHRLLRTG